MNTPRGFVLYDGPSAINGRRVVAIMTTSTSNAKTGPMPQVWFLCGDEEPHVARRNGNDVAICGGCPHRRGSCYVVLHRAPLSVYRAWVAGRYGSGEEALRWLDYNRPRYVRVGAYGDPMSAPLVVGQLARAVEPHGGRLLGYTHQWRRPTSNGFQPWLMASVDTPAEALRARSKGWRTFRVRLEGEPLDPTEVLCAAERERSNCSACGACDGASARPSIVATVHGLRHVVNKFHAHRARGGAA